MPVTSTAEVTGLDAALAARAAAVLHTHSASDISGTAVLTNDARLTDARTPLSHSHAPSDVTGTAVVTADSRLSDARKPAYVAGDGGTVTQLTSKSTGVTLNKLCGAITTHNAALAAGAEVAFVVTNSTVAATDCVIVCMRSGGTAAAYLFAVGAVGNGSFTVVISNASAASLSEALVLNFAVVKGVAS